MTPSLDQMLTAATGAPSAPDHALDGLEGDVWRRIHRDSAAAQGLRIQALAAGAALGIGLAIGWSQHPPARAESIAATYASYEAAGPLARLENGL